MVEAVDKTIEKRIDKLTKELSQKTAELLEVRAAFVQLSQKKQEVQRRERALSRQVDVAVEMIAALKQRLSESEEELHRKEEIAAKMTFNGHSRFGTTPVAPLNYQCKIMVKRENEFVGSSVSVLIEVVTFNHFLEEAAEKEVRGKARLQHFIENLLQRVDLAERQLEYYQKQQMLCHHTDGSEQVVIPDPQQVVRARPAPGQHGTAPASSSLDLHSVSLPKTSPSEVWLAKLLTRHDLDFTCRLPAEGAAECNKQKAKAWGHVNQEEHLPGDRHKFKIAEVWMGTMKKKM
ncbi:hypothetical protein WISP_04453 [Willisornis vidua]|uniref:ZN365 protein n=1 Tax=Willisornis vidua TaxID=1566151 RepID=A0ABQ9DXR3_9PASS|nr:hypothetical protein WISP_04453 [Willisornis vidua]